MYKRSEGRSLTLKQTLKSNVSISNEIFLFLDWHLLYCEKCIYIIYDHVTIYVNF